MYVYVFEVSSQGSFDKYSEIYISLATSYSGLTRAASVCSWWSRNWWMAQEAGLIFIGLWFLVLSVGLDLAVLLFCGLKIDPKSLP